MKSVEVLYNHELHTIVIRDDGLISLTQLCSIAERDLHEYLQLSSTQIIIELLTDYYSRRNQLYIIYDSSTDIFLGCRELTYDCARWCSPEIAVAIYIANTAQSTMKDTTDSGDNTDGGVLDEDKGLSALIVKTYKEDNKQLTTYNIQLASSNKQLDYEVKRLTTDNATLLYDKDKAEEAMLELYEQKTALEQELLSFKEKAIKEFNSLEARLNTSLNTADELAEEVEHHRQSRDSMIVKLDRLTNECGVLRVELNRITNEYQHLKADKQVSDDAAPFNHLLTIVAVLLLIFIYNIICRWWPFHWY